MSLSEDPAFQRLQRVFDGGARDLKLLKLFESDPDRFQKYR